MRSFGIVGNINQGTITLGVNTVESGGQKDARVIMDYYLQDTASTYRVYVYLQIENFDELWLIYDNILNCQYSRLENWLKQCTRESINNGNLKKIYKTYAKSFEGGIKIAQYELKTAVLFTRTEEYNHAAVNWVELNKIFEKCANDKVDQLHLSCSMLMRTDIYEDSVETYIIGKPKDIKTMFKYIAIEKIPYYEYDKTCNGHSVNFTLKIQAEGNQFKIQFNVMGGPWCAEDDLLELITGYAKGNKLPPKVYGYDGIQYNNPYSDKFNPYHDDVYGI